MTIKPTHARSPAPPRPTEIAATADKTDAANRPSAELPAMSNKNLKDSFEPADTATSPMALAANDANLLNLALSHGGAKNQAQVDEAFRLITGLRVGRTNNYYWEGDPVFTNQDSNGTPSSMHELLTTLNSYHVMISPENLARWVDRMFALTVNRDFPYVQREFLDATEDSIVRRFSETR